MIPKNEESPWQATPQQLPSNDVDTVPGGEVIQLVSDPLVAERGALLARAQNRRGWKKLEPHIQDRARQLLLAAEYPSLNIITVDNVAMRKRLGWSQGQSQRTVRALKRAHLIDVQRRDITLPNGQRRTIAPAVWVYAPTDALLPSQMPKKRKGSLRSEVHRQGVVIEMQQEEQKRVRNLLEEALGRSPS